MREKYATRRGVAKYLQEESIGANVRLLRVALS
jgi:hypothetical protein